MAVTNNYNKCYLIIICRVMFTLMIRFNNTIITAPGRQKKLPVYTHGAHYNHLQDSRKPDDQWSNANDTGTFLSLKTTANCI